MSSLVKDTHTRQGLQIEPKNERIYTDEELAQAFPDVSPGHAPLGSRVIVQLRSPKTRSKGGIIMVNDTQETEKWNTQIGKVRAVGPGAFRYRSGPKEGQIFSEGAGCGVGDYIRIPKFNQDKWEVEHGENLVLFMLINDLDILAKVECNPLEIKAYI